LDGSENTSLLNYLAGTYMYNSGASIVFLFSTSHCWFTVDNMFGFVRALRSMRSTPRQHDFTQRFYIASKAAKGKVGVVVSSTAMQTVI